MKSNQVDYDNQVPLLLWEQVPSRMRLLQVKLKDGRIFDDIEVDERGKITGQIAEGVAGYHGGLNQSFKGIDSSDIEAVRSMKMAWYRFGLNPWIT